MNKPLTDREILEQAIQKAIDGGWKARLTEDGGLRILNAKGSETSWYSPGTFGSYSIIFNHDFAKALWGGSTDTYYGSYSQQDELIWQHNLRDMVIAKDPIKYLGENI
jgi:hypothetical protein